MKEILCALLVLRVVIGSSIVTKSMLYGPDDDSSFEPVQLQTKGTSDLDGITTARTVKIRKTSKELLRSLGYFEDEVIPAEDSAQAEVSTQLSPSDSEDLEDEDYYTDTTPISTTFSTEISQPKESHQIARREGAPATDTELQNRTKLFPVGRLWERTMPTRPMPGLMAILDAAFSCMWSGLGFECFSLKVVPMFRAMMGFPPVNPFGHPFYVLPRTTEAEEYADQNDEQDPPQDPQEADSKVLFTGRRRRRPFFGLKLIKGAMIVVAALKTILIPLFTGLSFISGKAIIVSLVAVVLTIAAGWSSAKNSDRRIYNQEPDTPYYM